MVQRDTKAWFLLYANQMAGRLEHVPPGISGLEHGEKSARYGYQLPVAQHKTVDAQILYRYRVLPLSGVSSKPSSIARTKKGFGVRVRQIIFASKPKRTV